MLTGNRKGFGSQKSMRDLAIVGSISLIGKQRDGTRLQLALQSDSVCANQRLEIL